MHPLTIGAVSAFLAVALGAFGAHGLEGRVAPDLLDVYRTGVDYHMFHSLGLIAVALLRHHADSPPARWSGRLFIIGLVLFSGSLYLLAVTGVRGLGMVTPFGGVAFLAGWVAFALAARRL